MNNFQKTIFALSIGIGFTTFSFAVDQCKGYTSVENEFPCGNYGNCTWWAAYKRPDLHIIMRRDAKYWFQDALTNNIPTGSEPKVGSIAVFPACGANNAGHVAYVEKINADTFEVSEMNYSENGKYGDGMKTATYKKSSLCGVTGFIYNNLYSEVDGVGSLVDPKSANEVGGNYDFVAIHPHEKGKRSTAVFQVLADANKCAYVKLSSLENKVSDGFITVKAYNEHYPGEEFDSNISTVYKAKYLPANIPLLKDKWNLVSFTTSTTRDQFGVTDYMQLECISTMNPSISMLKDIGPALSNRKNSPASIIINNGDYFFGGNGSLLSYLNTSNYINSNNGIYSDGYGRTIDEAIYLNSYNSVSYFQVYKNNNCAKVEIKNSKMSGVSWKKWDSSSVISSVSTGGSFTVNLPSEENWYIVGVSSKGDNIDDGATIKARCIR